MIADQVIAACRQTDAQLTEELPKAAVAEQSNSPLLSIKGLSVRFGGIVALENFHSMLRPHPLAAAAIGVDYRALQIANLRCQCHVYQNRRRARRRAVSLCLPGQFPGAPFDQIAGWEHRRRHRFDFRRLHRGTSYRVHAQFRGSDIEGGARRHIRHLPDRVDVSHAGGGNGNLQLYRSPASARGSRQTPTILNRKTRQQVC